MEDYKTESFAAEIDENFAYNQRLVAQNEQLEENIKNNQKELKKAEKALKACKSRILTEKETVNFDKVDRNIFGKIKDIQTISLGEYKSLVRTAFFCIRAD